MPPTDVDTRPGRRQRIMAWLRGLAAPRDWINPRRKRFWAIVAIVVYTLVGFFVAPWIVREQIVQGVGEALGRPVRLEGLRINPYVLSAEARGFAISEADGSALVGFERLYVNFQLSSLFRWAWTFREVTIERPSIEIVRLADGQLNLARLVPDRDEAPAGDEAGGLMRLVVGRFDLVEGSGQVTDRTRPTTFRAPLGPINVSVSNISTLPDARGRQQVVLHTERGSRIEWDGSLRIQPLHSSGRLEVDGPIIPVLLRYLQDELAIDSDSGHVALSLDYEIGVGREGRLEVALNNVDFAIRDLRVTQSDSEVLTLPELRIAGGRLRYPAREAAAQRLSVSGLRVFAWRSPEGVFSFERMFVPAVRGEPEAANAGTPETTTRSASGSVPPDVGARAEGVPLAEWKLGLDQLQLSDVELSFEDRTLREPARLGIRDLNVTLSELTNTPGARFPLDVSLSVPPGGRATIRGSVAAVPEVALETAVTVTGLEVGLVQPYLGEFAAVHVDEGVLELAANVGFDHGAVITSGEVSIDDLSVVADASRERLIGWRRVGVDRFEFASQEASLNVSEVAISSPYARLLIAEDRTTNFQQLVIDTSQTSAARSENDAVSDEAEAADAQPRVKVTVGRVRVEDGGADFTDLSLPIPFRSRIADLKGTLTTFSTASTEPARIDLQGQIDDYGLARIRGELMPLGPERFTDVTLLFRNVELPDLTPYTVQFAGRKIADGRMELDLRYRMVDGELKGDNAIVISNLELGDRVEHPDAFDLPLGLAVALLKGPDGNIDVDVPVEGNVNDPQFRLGGVIARAIVNLITNIVTSPFRLLGSLVGAESEDFDVVLFEPGRAELTPPEREKLAKLAEALALRPQLDLRLPSVVDPAVDGPALKVAMVDARIDATLKAQGSAEGEGGMYDERLRRALETLFRAQFADVQIESVADGFMVPRDPADPAGESVLDLVAYMGHLRDRLAAAAPIGEAELAALGRARVGSVVNGLIQDSAVTEDRLLEAAGDVGEPAEVAAEGGWVPMKLELDSRTSVPTPARSGTPPAEAAR